MARKTPNTHIAVHTIQTEDESGKLTEIKAGTAFKPSKELLAELDGTEAIRQMTDEDKEADALKQPQVTDRVDGPTGYADNTTTDAPVYPGNVSNPNDIPENVEANTSAEPAVGSTSSSDLDDKLPSSRSTRR